MSNPSLHDHPLCVTQAECCEESVLEEASDIGRKEWDCASRCVLLTG